MIKSDDINSVKMVLLENTSAAVIDTQINDEYILLELNFADTLSAVEAKEFIDKYYNEDEKFVSSSAYIDTADYITDEMQRVLIYAVIVIVLILLFTSSSYAIIPILLCIFGISAIITMGTNFIFDDISYISNAVAVILQLALAIDYALIFVHRYEEERKFLGSNTSARIALKKTIPEVSASSLTTISGLVALSFMSYGIGSDMAMVLIKSILISLCTVFFLLPILMVIFDGTIQKTKHKELVPSISSMIEKSINLRRVIVPLFSALAVVSIFFASKTNYTFSVNEIGLQGDLDTQIIEAEFDRVNSFVILTPTNEDSSRFIEELSVFDGIEKIVTLENFEFVEGITLYTGVNHEVVSAMLGIDSETSQMLFESYAFTNDEYENYVLDMDGYTIPVLYLINYLSEISDNLPESIKLQLYQLLAEIGLLEESFVNDKFKITMLNTSYDIEGEVTFDFVENILASMDKYFSEAHILGESVNSYELNHAFQKDKILVNGLSALFIVIILLLTFKSFITALVMIICIQTAINFNFVIPYLQNSSLFFIGYLVVVAIQMGATIDYAIVIVSRYKQLVQSLNQKEAIIKAVDMSFSTILSSGGVLALAGFVMYKISSDAVISSLGLCLARGTSISMLLVLLVLPSLLFMLKRDNKKSS